VLPLVYDSESHGRDLKANRITDFCNSEIFQEIHGFRWIRHYKVGSPSCRHRLRPTGKESKFAVESTPNCRRCM
jgi:hypothetical protein